LDAIIWIVEKEIYMKKAWKWILGIVIVLVVVATLVAVPFAMRSYMVANYGTNALPQGSFRFGGPMMRGNEGWQHPQVPGYNGNFYNMPYGQRGFDRGFSFNTRFSPFGFGFIFLGGLLRLIPLALFGLLLYGIYQLGKRSGMRAHAAPVQAVAAEVAPAASEPEKQEPINN